MAADEPTNGTATLTPEERQIVLLYARAIARDLMTLVKLPMRREVLAKTAWILEGSDGPTC